MYNKLVLYVGKIITNKETIIALYDRIPLIVNERIVIIITTTTTTTTNAFDLKYLQAQLPM